MDVVALKVDCKNLSNFENGILSIDLVTEKRVYSYEIEDDTVEQLVNSLCKLNVIAFAGINAAGKTTVLNILSNVLQTFVGNTSLSYDLRLMDYFENELEVETFYYHKTRKRIYKLVSTIRKSDEAREAYFSQELLYSKKVTAQTNRVNAFDFGDCDLEMERAAIDNSFLKKEDSIFSSIMNQYDFVSRSVMDMCGTTNHNILSRVSLDLMIPFVRYLDSSIEYLKVKDVPEGSMARMSFELKFKRHDKSLIVELDELSKYLSSGTIKGISCLSSIAFAFTFGGYVLIDEIENHLNKTIVINLVSLFTSRINEQKAVLLFSTHYSEILDSLDRSDGIYLLSKSDAIKMKKFSQAAFDKDRKDKKRSDLVLSGVLDTAPSYRAYRALTEELEKYLWQRSAHDENR